MSGKWTEEELRLAVEAYVQMYIDEQNGTHFVKKEIYRKLSQGSGRTEKSYEYRMQNISHVFSLLNRPWVTGLKPAKNVGLKTIETIQRLIEEVESIVLVNTEKLDTPSIEKQATQPLTEPLGIQEPKANYSNVTNYSRDQSVRAWVLEQADGRCECCVVEAPFITTDGEPFLEVHHLRHLADGGSDTVSNAVALCPNCHREMHYGAKQSLLLDSMYSKISRLVVE